MAYLQSLETQVQQMTPSHNGQAQNSGKSKPSHSSPHFNYTKKATSTRSASVDKAKTPARDVSSDRNGRTASPGVVFVVSESPNEIAQRQHLGRDSSTERTVSSSDSRDGFSNHGTPMRAPPSVSTEATLDEDEAATPTQAVLHARGPSDTQFRLDLSNPPSSPFNIKF
jgi:hypothetical protein